MPKAYRGDARLGRMLAEAGIGLTVAAVRDIAAAAAAAPRPLDGDAWMAMVGPAAALDAVAGLRGQLRALLAAAADAAHPAGAADAAGRLAALRAVLKRRGLDGFVVPRADPHQGEFIPGGAERLAWLTGFTGSAGLAVVLAEHAALFVDGRYTLQVREQVDGRLYAFRHLTEEPPPDWLAGRLAKGMRLGFDPWLHTPNQAAQLRKACEKAGADLVATADNPLDELWTARPPPPLSPMVGRDAALAGATAAEKRAQIAEALAGERQDVAFIAAPESVAWLLNVRGGDVPFTPLSLAFALVHADGVVDLFVDGRKVTAATRRHLGDGVRLHEPAALPAALDALGRERKVVRVDRDGAPAWVWQRLLDGGAMVADGADPCLLPKACKNAAELAGMRAAHRRDGAAMARFLAWLAASAADGGLTERTAAARLEAFRREADLYRGPSFETISAAGPNGAVVHYRSNERTDRPLAPGTLYLVDSGGQYLDGTTDVTRTVAVGRPTAAMRDRFTRVLRGHIALATAVFPKGTAGPQLDALARRPLWEAGLDYDHGTGHGVGCYLGVHEGPARIAKAHSRTPLAAGMVLSNEPGFYCEGQYGIRTENLVAVEARADLAGEGRAFLGFETLTLVPIDRALVEPAMLTPTERAWLDAYHVRVRGEIAPLVDAATRQWLEEATHPMGCDGSW